MFKFPAKIKFNFTFIALTIAAGLTGLFVEFSSEMREGEFEKFDERILQIAFDWRAPKLNSMMVDITALGSMSVLTLLTTFVVLFALIIKKYRVAIFMSSTMILAATGNHFLKLLIDRDRPDMTRHLVEVSSQSYPSGHTMAAAAFYSAIGLIAWQIVVNSGVRTLIVLASILVVGLVGFSRIYLGVHYPTDVLAGFLLGSALSSALAILIWQKENSKASK